MVTPVGETRFGSGPDANMAPIQWFLDWGPKGSPRWDLESDPSSGSPHLLTTKRAFFMRQSYGGSDPDGGEVTSPAIPNGCALSWTMVWVWTCTSHSSVRPLGARPVREVARAVV